VSGHLGPEIPALVDGELDHAARERALAHLSGCAPCRSAVEAERRFKARLRGLGTTGPAPAEDLSARLRHLAAAEGEPLRPGARPGQDKRGPAGTRPPNRPGRHVRTRASRAALGGAVLAVGLGTVLALGGPARPPARPPLDPASDAFVADFASTGPQPLLEPAQVAVAGAPR